METMRYISENLEDEIIVGRLDLLSRNISERKLGIDKLERKKIERMARYQSFRIEHPELSIPYSVPRNGNCRKIKKGVRNLTRAFKWGCENFDSENFDESFLGEIVCRVLPEICDDDVAEYRKDAQGTYITGASTTPPYPQKLVEKEIPLFEAAMQERLASHHPMDRLETAIYAHFHITRMHPFTNGNGRTSRLVQDVILHNFDFPVPIIEFGERSTYCDLLNKAVYDWKEQKNWKNEDLVTEGEGAFYKFMAGKINVSLDKLTRRNP